MGNFGERQWGISVSAITSRRRPTLTDLGAPGSQISHMAKELEDGNSGNPGDGLPSTMARQQTAFDLASAWLLDYERRPPALGWSHAAGGGG